MIGAEETRRPLAGFRLLSLKEADEQDWKQANAHIVVVPYHAVASIREGANHFGTIIVLMNGDRLHVDDSLLHVRQRLQSIPEWGFMKLQEFMDEAADFFDDREDADEDGANREMRLNGLLKTAAYYLREGGYIR